LSSFAELLHDIQQLLLHSNAQDERLIRGIDQLLDGSQSAGSLTGTESATPGDFWGKLLYEDPRTGFIAVWMVWGPGAVTPIHDHGTWGVFMVCDGALEFHNFARVSQDQVVRVAAFTGSRGDISYVLPPDQEIHQLRNSGREVARSLHFYGRNIGF
jgi:predicted metal-dependent enzyme (double-stranded beta helix superfamily)